MPALFAFSACAPAWARATRESEEARNVGSDRLAGVLATTSVTSWRVVEFNEGRRTVEVEARPYGLDSRKCSGRGRISSSGGFQWDRGLVVTTDGARRVDEAVARAPNAAGRYDASCAAS